MPGDTSEISGREEVLQLRQENFQQNAADVYAVRWTGGGGFGDPFDRVHRPISRRTSRTTPSRRQRRVPYMAPSSTTEGIVDVEATAAERARIRTGPLEWRRGKIPQR